MMRGGEGLGSLAACVVWALILQDGRERAGDVFARWLAVGVGVRNAKPKRLRVGDGFAKWEGRPGAGLVGA
jgi:hypothetical protein